MNSNWLKSWKQRYLTLDKIKEDAENLVVEKVKLKILEIKLGKNFQNFNTWEF